jgi:O-antigen/teichoic acid export membrane protein
LPRSVTRSIFFITLLAFPAVIGLVVLAPVIIQIIPKYEKWTPALIPLALLAVNSIFGAFTTQLTNLLNAIGKIRITFYLMIMWTVLTFLLVPYLASRLGATGAALGYAIVSASSIVAVYLAKRYVNFSLADSVVKPLTAAAAMAAVLLIVRSVLPPNLYSLSILLVVGIAVYFVVIVGMVGKSLLDDAKRSVKTLLNRD